MLDLWAIARYDLRLTDQAFSRLTPRLFDALLKRKQAADRQEYLRTGVIAAAVINFSMCHPEKPVSPSDFVPGTKLESGKDLTKMTPEEQARHVVGQLRKKTMKRRS